MPEESDVAILFADVSGSTRLYDQLGDARAQRIVGHYVALLSRVNRACGGTLVKTIGDEVMCVFPSGEAAARGALAMQEAVSAESDVEGQALSVRIGFHVGPVIRESGDVFGDAVNVAARMAGEAKAHQIVTTEDTVRTLPPQLVGAARFLIETVVKGKKAPLRIYELTWGATELLTQVAMTAMRDPKGRDAGAVCIVTHDRHSFELGESEASLSMGRGLGNTLTVQHTNASRFHAAIEWRRGKVFLLDKSTNGTFVHTSTHTVDKVHREERELQGDGVIGLGLDFELGDPDAICFSVTI